VPGTIPTCFPRSCPASRRRSCRKAGQGANHRTTGGPCQGPRHARPIPSGIRTCGRVLGSARRRRGSGRRGQPRTGLGAVSEHVPEGLLPRTLEALRAVPKGKYVFVNSRAEALAVLAPRLAHAYPLTGSTRSGGTACMSWPPALARSCYRTLGAAACAQGARRCPGVGRRCAGHP
jgi:hypothetical protein